MTECWLKLSSISNRNARRHDAQHPADCYFERMRLSNASNLGIEPSRIRYGNVGASGRLGTTDPHRMIYYRDQ